MKADEIITDQQSLCIFCGICCDGTLFGKAPLTPFDNLEPLTNAGIEILTKDTKKSFKLGCAAFREHCCGVYAERPTICRSFRCELLKKIDHGEILWSEARQKIVRVQKIREKLKTELLKTLPKYAEISVPALRKLMPEQQEIIADPILSKKWANVSMCLSILLDCLRTDFRSVTKNKDSASK